MKRRQFLPQITLALAGAALGLSLASPALAQGADHSHGAADAHQLSLNNGKQWATDAPLRQSMTRIRALVAPQIDAAHAGKLRAADYQALARQTEEQIGVIVKECKLAPQADEALHIVIARMGEGLEVMNGKSATAKPVDGLLHLAEAINDYGAHFEHAGFKPIALRH